MQYCCRSQLENGSLFIRADFPDQEGLQGDYQCVASLPDIGSVVSRSASLKIARKLSFKYSVSLFKSFMYLILNTSQLYITNYCTHCTSSGSTTYHLGFHRLFELGCSYTVQHSITKFILCLRCH